MKKMSYFFLKCLVPGVTWVFKEEPSQEVVKYYVNDLPIIGINGSVHEVYHDLDFLTFFELKKHFPKEDAFYYQAVRFLGQPEFHFPNIDGVCVTIEKTIDQTILHLVSEYYHRDKLDSLLNEIKKAHTDYYIGSIYQTIEGKLYEILYQKQLKVSFAESVTGGMLASRLINVKGASEVIECSYVTYSNEAKSEILGVDPKLIKKYGVVSEEVAEAMAQGLAKISKADVNVSVTGYAGGNKDNPNDGLCYFSIIYKDFINIERHLFEGDRNEVRTQVASYILWRVGQLLTLKP